MVRKEHPRIIRVILRSDEARCYHNNFLIAAVKNVGDRVGVKVRHYDFSEPHNGKDVCERILCPMKSVQRYCNEGHDILSARDMYNALSERPVRGTTACVCSLNETQKTLEINKLEGFSKYHNFKFEDDGIRLWRAHNVGEGKVIPYRDFIVKHQGPTFFPVRVPVNTTLRQVMILVVFSLALSFRKFSDLESHLDAGEHRQVQQGCDTYTLYDKIRRDWAEKFLTVDKDVKSCSQPITPCNSDHLADSSSTELESGWALHKLRSEAVRFSVEVKQYLTEKFDLGESTGSKEDRGKVAADMRVAKTQTALGCLKEKTG